MPHLLETSPSEAGLGFRPASEHLQLGRWQSGNVYLAYGHYRNGILLAPLTAAKQYGRWAFAELCEVYRIESDFKDKVESEFDKMLQMPTVAPGNR